jgi:CRISPR system Cascade subunit CasC
MELTSGLYYGYAVIDVPALVSNLTGTPAKEWLGPDADRRLAGEVASRLVFLIATATPGAKKGSTAPYAHAEMLLLEAGSRQPRTLANAFRKPVELRGDLYAESIKALKAHVSSLDLAYGAHEVRTGLCISDGSASIEAMGGTAKSLPQLSDWLKHMIARGRA